MQTHSTHYSPACLSMIKQWQGLSLEKYKNARGRWVIGYGHELTRGDNTWDSITPAQAEALLADDLNACAKKLLTCQLKFIDRFQFEALMVLIFSSDMNHFLRTGKLPCIARQSDSRPVSFQP